MLLVLLALLAAAPEPTATPPPDAVVEVRRPEDERVFGLTNTQLVSLLSALGLAGYAILDRRKALASTAATTGAISERVAGSQTDLIREMIAPVQTAALAAATSAAGARGACDDLTRTVKEGNIQTGHRLDTIDGTLKDHGERLGRLESGQEKNVA
jgi:hypothetical protein